MRNMPEKGKTIFGVLFVTALFATMMLLAGHVENNENVQKLIASFGPIGILITGFIGGLNLIVPVPATAFIPVFSAAGFGQFVIIAMLVIGTTTADLLSFVIGTALGPRAQRINHRMLRFLQKNCEKHPGKLQIIIFLYAAFAPFPNEVLLLPLGALGVRLRTLLVAFTTGNILHISLLTFGLTSLL